MQRRLGGVLQKHHWLLQIFQENESIPDDQKRLHGADNIWAEQSMDLIWIGSTKQRELQVEEGQK